MQVRQRVGVILTVRSLRRNGVADMQDNCLRMLIERAVSGHGGRLGVAVQDVGSHLVDAPGQEKA